VNYDVVLAGDNREASRDSRDFGPVPVRQVKWVVWPHRRPFDSDRTPPTL
jgi:type IV secretory pathway protease TraF